jgi:O-antigen ligase
MQRLGPLSATRPASDLAVRLPPVALVGVAGLAAIAFGTVLAENPFAAIVLLVLVPLAFGAPVASLGVLLFVTLLVPFDIQNKLSVLGRLDSPGLLVIDVLLLLGLCRVGMLLVTRRLRMPPPLLLAGALGLILAVALIEGIAIGYDLREAGHEARRVVLGVGAFILAWPILGDEAARQRLYWVLLLLGLAVGLSGLAQWLVDFDLVAAGDAGVRPGVDLTSAGRGQLQGGLYAFPAAATLSFAALVSQRIRSAEARWLLGAILVLNLVCLVLTYERTFWAATAVGCLVVAVKSGREARRTAVRWGAIGTVALLVALAALGQVRTAAERLVSVTQYRTDESFTHRTLETETVIEAISERPLTGSGFGDTITWGKEGVFSTLTTPYAHNGYLWLAWKLGIPAACLVVLAVGAAVLRRGPAPKDEWLATLRTGSQAALLGLLLVNVTFPAFNTLSITAAMGLLVAICVRPGEHD